MQNLARLVEPSHQRAWRELLTSKSTGLILRSIKTEFKFVSSSSRSVNACLRDKRSSADDMAGSDFGVS